MPAYSSHYIFAKELMAQLKEKTKDFTLNESAVILGTQGPDIFFFHRIMPVVMQGKSLRKIGSALHRAKPSKIFDSMIEYIKSSNNKSIAYSYAIGFLCHYSLDRTGHPFVYSIQEKIKNKYPKLHGFTIHNTIEFSLDNLLLNTHLGVEKPYEFDTYSTFPNSATEINEISSMMEYVINNSIDDKVRFNDIQVALKDTKKMQSVLHDKSGKGTALVKGIEDILTPFRGGFRVTVMLRPRDLPKSIKFGNLNHGVWANPNKPEEKKTESFQELFECAKSDCLKLVEGFRDCYKKDLSTADLTGEISFLTGMPVV